ALMLDVATSHQRGIALTQQHDAVVAGDQLCDALGIRALAIQQMAFGGPAAQAGFAAISGFDQGHDGCYVGGGCRPEDGKSVREHLVMITLRHGSHRTMTFDTIPCPTPLPSLWIGAERP